MLVKKSEDQSDFFMYDAKEANPRLMFAGHRKSSIGLFQCMNFLKIEGVYNYMAINFDFKSTNGLVRCDWFSRYENVYKTRSTGQ